MSTRNIDKEMEESLNKEHPLSNGYKFKVNREGSILTASIVKEESK